MCEAFSALRSGLSCLESAESHEEDDAQLHWLYLEAGMRCRYSFLLAANALLLSLETNRALYDDFEKLPTLLKFEVVCMALGKKLDRGNNLYSKIKEIVKCRNEFVHPKPRRANGRLAQDGKDFEIVVARTKSCDYPTYFSLLEPKHTVNAVGDILKFLSWILFDICEYSVKEGAMLLGIGSLSKTGDITILANKYGFDTRTFDEDAEQHL